MANEKKRRNGHAHRKGAEASSSISELRRVAITAAKELVYGQEVIDKIKTAKTEYEISRTLEKARLNKWR